MQDEDVSHALQQSFLSINRRINNSRFNREMLFGSLYIQGKDKWNLVARNLAY